MDEEMPKRPSLKRLSMEDIVEVNIRIGEKGVLLNQSSLEIIISMLSHASDIKTCATILLKEIIALHPFLDGNKRTALAATVSFLAYNGVKFKYDDEHKDDIGRFLNKIAMGKASKNDINRWIERMCEWTKD